MAELDLELVGWLGPTDGGDEARATMGSLRIAAGEGKAIPITEVEDSIGQTVRTHINVPLYPVAEWLLMNWWRLRWEGKPEHPTPDWRRTHRLSGIGGDYAWPALELSSDGDFIQMRMEADDAPDVSAIRYLRRVSLDVSAEEFEAAVERFADLVEARLASLLPRHRVLSELRAELAEERKVSSSARMCRWQALAGIDPGDAPEAWTEAAQRLVEDAGSTAGEEIMSVLPELEDGLGAAERALEAMKASSTTVDLAWVGSPVPPLATRERPWQKGARLANELRKRRHLGSGPLGNGKLSELLSTILPLQGERVRNSALAGGFRNGVSGGRTKIVFASPRLANQRFYLARLIGAAHALTPDQHLVPVTRSNSALQKMERSFAQELLCPWAALDAFMTERGLDDEALAEAAEYFQVSELLVRSTLANHGRLPRFGSRGAGGAA